MLAAQSLFCSRITIPYHQCILHSQSIHNNQEIPFRHCKIQMSAICKKFSRVNSQHMIFSKGFLFQICCLWECSVVFHRSKDVKCNHSSEILRASDISSAYLRIHVVPCPRPDQIGTPHKRPDEHATTPSKNTVVVLSSCEIYYLASHSFVA